MPAAAAKRYAKAVFAIALDDGEVDEWGARIAAVRGLLSDPAVADILTNPTIPVADRIAVITGAAYLPDTKAANLAALLIESGRVADVDAVAEEYERLADDAAGRIRATVTTAVTLPSADRDLLGRRLSEALSKEVRMDVVVDPRILGGMKLQYGDRLVDASVATKLQQLRRRLAAS